MAKTKNIEFAEREALCAMVISMYQKLRAHDPELVLNAYLPNYDNLREHIQLQFPKQSTSISNNRLRKLFYQSNNSEVLTFGMDFIDALYLYGSGYKRSEYFDRKNKSHIVPREKTYLALWGGIIISILVLIASLAFLRTSKIDVVTGVFEEDFNVTSITSLNQNGWHLQDYESGWFAKQDSQGFLMLYTLPGGYWVKPGEEIRISNTLVRPLESMTSRAKMSVVDFTPEQRWQGVSLILFDENLTGRNCLTYNYSFNAEGGGMFNSYYVKSGVPYGKIIIWPSSGEGDNRIHLGFEWNDSTLILNAGRTNIWGPISKIGELPLRFKPAYIGIAANQGYTDDFSQPLNADTMAIYIDRIEIE